MPHYDLYVAYAPVTLTAAQAQALRRRTDDAGKLLVVVGATALASRDFAAADDALAAMRPEKGAFLRFERESDLTPEALNAWARRAGIAPFAEPGNATYVGNGVACVHRLKGPARVDFGRTVIPVDPLTGKQGAPLRIWTPSLEVGRSAAIGYKILSETCVRNPNYLTKMR